MNKLNRIPAVLLLIAAFVAAGRGEPVTNQPTQDELWRQWHDAAPAWTNPGQYPPAVETKTARWTERVIPLPHEIKVAGSVTASAGEIWLKPADTNVPAINTAVGLINAFARGQEADAKIKIEMILGGDDAKRLAKLPNTEQAYAIQTEKSLFGRQTTIELVANTPVGLLYGARTLTQLVRPPATVAPDTALEIPLVTINDWPDVNERGQGACSAERYLDWSSQWKLNLIEFQDSGLFNQQGQPVINIPKQALTKGVALGVKVVPMIMHMDAVVPNSPQLQQARTNPDYKHLIPLLAIQDPNKRFDPSYPGLCLNNPATLDAITAWMILLVQAIQGYHSDLMVFNSECGLTFCWCKDCAGKNFYETEVAAFLKAFDQVKQKYPDLRLRIGLSQGSFPFNDKIVAMVKDRKDVGLSYYHGGYTYISDRKPMIYPLLEEYARSGHYLGVYPQITPCWFTVFPWTAPEFIHFRATEFADKQLSSVSSYAVPDKYYYEFNLMALAKWLWNAKGRTPQEFARAYATVTGVKNSDLYARWAMKAGEAGWILAESGFNGWVAYDPAIGFLGVKPFDLRWGSTTNVKYEVQTAIPTAQEAVALAQEAGDRLMLDESEACLASLEAIGLCGEISKIVRGKAKDEATKKTLAGKLDRMDYCAHIVRSRVFDWSDRNEARKAQRALQPRVNHTAVGLLRTCDTLRIVSARFGIPDPRPESRIVDLVEWSAKDFTKGQARFEIDITDKVPKQGATYQLCFDLGGVVRKIEAVFVNPVTGARKVVGLSPEPDNERSCMYGESYYECRIKIPAVPSGEKVLLVIAMQGTTMGDFPDKNAYSGLIGLRRVWEIGEESVFSRR